MEIDSICRVAERGICEIFSRIVCWYAPCSCQIVRIRWAWHCSHWPEAVQPCLESHRPVLPLPQPAPDTAVAVLLFFSRFSLDSVYHGYTLRGIAAATDIFLFSKRQYAAITGRGQKEHDVIAYHLRQPFKPGRSRRNRQTGLAAISLCR